MLHIWISPCPPWLFKLLLAADKHLLDHSIFLKEDFIVLILKKIQNICILCLTPKFMWFWSEVISEVYAFFALQCKHKADVTAWHGINFHKNNLWNFLVTGNYYVNYQNDQNLMLLTSSDTERTLRYLFLFTNSAQRELVSICTQSIRDSS